MANPETILITGASAGIGLALVKRWLERGDRVLALQRRSSALTVREARWAATAPSTCSPPSS